MQRILVIGAGVMGSGIAQNAAQAGYTVQMSDPDPAALGRALGQIAASLDKLEAKGRLARGAREILANLSVAGDLMGAAQADMVIEAAPEKLELKRRIFAQVEDLASPSAVLASNTSSIPISTLAQGLKRPERLLGLHFTPPVPLSPMVEVVRHQGTSEEAFQAGLELVKGLGKQPLAVRKDVTGFVINRVYAAALSQALALVEQGVASAAEVDMGMRLGYGWSLGPMQIADLVGLDTVLLIMDSFARQGEQCMTGGRGLVEEMVEQGRLGRKSGRGFYEYS
ncbi:MAG: 3-hydroxyacyl-CoA dehydrogenase family protein [Desulfarculus sp.]|nr:3-hydroxyacyl-CoA dehydrogenase family protein [Desulfarculus sp.]